MDERDRKVLEAIFGHPIRIKRYPANRQRWTGERHTDTQTLRKVTGAGTFHQDDYDAVLAKVSEAGYCLESTIEED